jgi:hypothetical protein
MSHHFQNGYNNEPIQYNGRVLLIGNEPKNPLMLYERPSVPQSSFHNALTGNWTNTPLSIAFFSSNNIDIIQNGLRKGVYDMSRGQYLIGKQSDDVLKIIMRSTYLQFAKHNPNIPIKQQIAELNNLVVDYAVNQVYGETQGYLKYLQDVSTLAMPIALPVMTDDYEPSELIVGL